MAITNYSELQTAIGQWMNNPNGLTAYTADFIALAESEFNRRIRLADNETRATVTLANGVGALPSDFAQVKSARDNVGPLAFRSSAEFGMYEAQSLTGRIYTLEGTNLRARTSQGGITLVYWRTIPPLAANSTNWLLTKSPNAYLFAALSYAAAFERDNDAMATFKAMAEAQLTQLAQDDAMRAGTMEVRAA
jgi:hypothetical protein